MEIYEVSEPEYKTVINKKLMPVSCVFWFACIAAAIIIGYTVDNAIARDVLVGALIIICVASILVLFLIIMPKLRVKQARLDIKNYDFTPYVADGKEENFYSEIPIEIHRFKSSIPFNEKLNEFETDSKQEISDYLKGFSNESRLEVVYLDSYNEFLKFYVYGTENGLKKQSYSVKKNPDGELIEVVISELHRISFTEDGIKIGGYLMGYKRVTATVEVTFTFNTYARILLDCGNGIGASFAISPKIIAALDKFGVTINDRFIADYILNNPALAFDKIAAFCTPKRIKKYIDKVVR